MYRILIADGADGICTALEDMFQGKYQVQLLHDGNQVLEQLRCETPDLLVLDLFLPGIDGISLLQIAQAEGFHPTTLAMSRLVNDYVSQAMERFHVNYLMVKPCDIHALALRISDILENLDAHAPQQKDIRMQICDILTQLGLPVKLKGFGYLCEAILLMREDTNQQITKELYPKVARLFRGTGPQVERAIRNAIVHAWENRDEKLWRKYFRCDLNQNLTRPTNAEFILQLVHFLGHD